MRSRARSSPCRCCSARGSSPCSRAATPTRPGRPRAWPRGCCSRRRRSRCRGRCPATRAAQVALAALAGAHGLDRARRSRGRRSASPRARTSSGCCSTSPRSPPPRGSCAEPAAARLAEPLLLAGIAGAALYGLSERLVPGVVDLTDVLSRRRPARPAADLLERDRSVRRARARARRGARRRAGAPRRASAPRRPPPRRCSASRCT